MPAQAIAQVCELTWQLRGQAEGRQVEGAKVGITVNQGLFGHGSSVAPDHSRTNLGRRARRRQLSRWPSTLNHTIVHARDARASADFVSEILGLPAPRP